MPTSYHIDHATAKEIMRKATELLATLPDVTVEAEGGTVGQTDFVLRFRFTPTSAENAQARTDAARINWQLHCGMFNLAPVMFGRTFPYHGKRMKVIGIRPKATRFPVLCAQEGTGKQVCFPAETIARFLA